MDKETLLIQAAMLLRKVAAMQEEEQAGSGELPVEAPQDAAPAETPEIAETPMVEPTPAEESAQPAVSLTCASCGHSETLDAINEANKAAAGDVEIEAITEGDSVRCPACEGGVMSAGAPEVPAAEETPAADPLAEDDLAKEAGLKEIADKVVSKLPPQLVTKFEGVSPATLANIPPHVLEQATKIIEALGKGTIDLGEFVAKSFSPKEMTGITGVVPADDPHSNSWINQQQESQYNIHASEDSLSTSQLDKGFQLAALILYAKDKGLLDRPEWSHLNQAIHGHGMTLQASTPEESQMELEKESGMVDTLRRALPAAAEFINFFKKKLNLLDPAQQGAVANLVENMGPHELDMYISALTGKTVTPDMRMASGLDKEAMNMTSVKQAIVASAIALMLAKGAVAGETLSKLNPNLFKATISKMETSPDYGDALKQLGAQALQSIDKAQKDIKDKDAPTPGQDNVPETPQDAPPAYNPADDVWKTASVDMSRVARYL